MQALHADPTCRPYMQTLNADPRYRPDRQTLDTNRRFSTDSIRKQADAVDLDPESRHKMKMKVVETQILECRP